MPSHSKVVAAVVEFAEELFPGFVFDSLEHFPSPLRIWCFANSCWIGFDKFQVQVQVSLLLALVGFKILIWSAKIKMCTCWS